MLSGLALVVGGANSGKSGIAERLVAGSGLAPVYLATARAQDDEMAAKIAAHRAARGPEWRCVEAPLDAAGALAGAGAGEAWLLDCATFWLTNHLLADSDLRAETDRLLAVMAAAPCPVVVVSNEVGQGIVPENRLARRFRSEQGRLNQRLAAAAGLAIGVMAGLPLVLKGKAPEWL